MATDDFQSKYASLMESMIKSAVAETTKLFETMVDELKAEISRISKENEHLKIRCSQIENDKGQPKIGTGDTESLSRTHSASEKRDTAVQCDLVPLQDIMVENCQQLGYSFSSLEHQQEKMHSSLQKKHRGETCEEESCQMALKVVKEESCCHSCSFMEEKDVDLTVVCRQVQGNNAGSPLSSAGETEGPLIKEVMSLHEKDPLTLKPCHLENNEGLQTNTQSCEPKRLLVIQRPLIQDAKTETPHITPQSQARVQTSRQVFVPPVLTLSATSTTQNTQNILVSSLKAHTLSSAQPSSVVAAVVSAQKTNSPSSTAATIPHETPPLSSVPQKTFIITTRNPRPVGLAQTTVTSTVNESMIQPLQKIIIIPREMSPVVSQKQQTLILMGQPPEPAPAVLASSPIFISSSQQSSISVNTRNTLEAHVTVPSPQIHTLVHRLSTVDAGTVSNTVCAMSQNRDVSDNLESQKPSESVSETADALTEPPASLRTFVPPKSDKALSVEGIPLCNKQKTSAVVRLTRLPFTISNEETVLVSKFLSNEWSNTFIPTQAPSSSEEALLPRNASGQTSSPSDVPESSSETCPYLDVSQTSEDGRDFPDQPTNSAFTLSTVSEPGAIGVSELSTTSYTSCKFSFNDSLNGDAQDCALLNDTLVQHNHSAGLIKLSSIMSKDTSDPHLQMTKSQFLAQLEISPIGQAPKEVSSNSSEDVSGGNGKKLHKKSVVPQLRRHLRAHLQAKRTDVETTVEMKTALIASQKAKLDNNSPSHKNQSSVHVNPEGTDESNSITLTSGPSENKSTTGGSELSADNASLKKDIGKLDHSSLGLRLSSSTQQVASHRTIDISSRGQSSSSSRINITESFNVCPSKSTFSKSGTTCLLSSISSTPLTRRRSLVSKDVTDKKGGNKRKLYGVSPGRYSACISQKTNIKTGSPCAGWPRLSQDIASPKTSGDLALSKKPRLIEDHTICKNMLTVVNAKKLTTVAKVNTVANVKKSNQSFLQIGVKRRQSLENQAACKDMKKVVVKGIWTPPLLPASEISPTSEAMSKKETTCHNQRLVYAPSSSLHPIPVRAPPMISPLQPLSVIGGRLLKNQCGERGRVFNTSAALENQVGLHTRSLSLLNTSIYVP